MSYCDLINDANDINLCGDELIIGALVDTATKVNVIFTNKATSRVQAVEATVDVGIVSVAIPTDLSPGHVYSIRLQVSEHDVNWYPYEFDGSVYSIGADEVDSASVLFIKVFSEKPAQQWITLQ